MFIGNAPAVQAASAPSLIPPQGSAWLVPGAWQERAVIQFSRMNPAIPLAEFGEILGKGAVRGLVRYPPIKGSGEQRIAQIQKYHKLLWSGLDRQEQAIALNISVKELTEALNHPPVALLV